MPPLPRRPFVPGASQIFSNRLAFDQPASNLLRIQARINAGVLSPALASSLLGMGQEEFQRRVGEAASEPRQFVQRGGNFFEEARRILGSDPGAGLEIVRELIPERANRSVFRGIDIPPEPFEPGDPNNPPEPPLDPRNVPPPGPPGPPRGGPPSPLPPTGGPPLPPGEPGPDPPFPPGDEPPDVPFDPIPPVGPPGDPTPIPPPGPPGFPRFPRGGVAGSAPGRRLRGELIKQEFLRTPTGPQGPPGLTGLKPRRIAAFKPVKKRVLKR